MIETSLHDLPHGISLSCRSVGTMGRPVLMFLHGFPEAAFVWDGLLEHFSRPENGGFRCIASNLRELQHSPAQQAASAYMNFLIRPDAEALLTEDDYRRLWEFLPTRAPTAARPPG